MFAPKGLEDKLCCNITMAIADVASNNHDSFVSPGEGELISMAFPRWCIHNGIVCMCR